MALIARFMFSRAVCSSEVGAVAVATGAGSGSGSGDSKLPWMLAVGSLAEEVDSVAVDRFDPTLGSTAVLGVVVMVAEGDSLPFREGGVDLLVAEAVPEPVLVRLGTLFSRNPSMNSMPIHRKM